MMTSFCKLTVQLNPEYQHTVSGSSHHLNKCHANSHYEPRKSRKMRNIYFYLPTYLHLNLNDEMIRLQPHC